jgi:predicted transcriptional regulator
MVEHPNRRIPNIGSGSKKEQKSAAYSGFFDPPANRGNIRPTVIRLFKNRLASGANQGQSFALGTLEFELMEVLWSRGESNVRDVIPKLSRPLAYTTVMTTLDRLFKKGLLDRRKSDRAFFYSPSFSRQEWERRRAGNLVAGFLSGPHPSRELLLSCLLEAVGEHDAELLDELEKKIRSRRKELLRQGQP